MITNPLIICLFWTWLTFILGIKGIRKTSSAPVGSVAMKIVNNAGYPIELFWKNIYEKPVKLVKQTTKPIRNSSDTLINSYDTHQFMIKYLDVTRAGNVSFTKGPKEEVVTVTFDEESNNLKVVQTTKFDEVMDTIKQATKNCDSLRGDAYSACVAGSIVDDINRLSEGKSMAEKYLAQTASKLRNYTCADENRNQTEPLSSYNTMIGNKTYTVNILQDIESAKIWYVDDFISQEECDIFEKHGRPLLRRATVAGEDGNSVVSEHRKAQQASYNFHFERYGDDPLWDLSQRILALANGHGGFEMSYEGQEGFTIIQYNVDDQYTPHCDGSCDGSPHVKGGRVATALMYCKAPTRGGATVFTKTDIVVKPKVGTATFFSYRGPDGKMDDAGYTEHSGCPIIDGEKWVITFWMRDGVTSEEPWDIYDPSGVKRLMEDDYVDTKADDINSSMMKESVVDEL